MSGKKKSKWQHQVAVGVAILIAMMLLLSLVGCERPKSSGLPTIEPVTTTAVSMSASPTTISVDVATPTPGIAPPSSPTVAAQDVSPTPPASPTKPGSSETVTYTIQSGDTLYSIAQRYGMTLDEIMKLNNITDSSSLTVGQVLIISGDQASPTTPPVSNGKETVHIVQKGENLFRIALRYGVTVQAIASRNKIVNPSLIWTGQKLVIPAGNGGSAPPSGQVHVVQPGENLYRIALRYDTTPWAIAVANGLSNTSFIYVGQRLRIP